MKQEYIKAYAKLREELDLLANKIFNYVYDNYNRFLEFESYSRHCDINVHDDVLEIIYFDYYDNCDRYYLPSIPINLLDDESLWKKFLDEYYELEIAEEEAEKKDKEKEERELYEELKKKYG